MTSDLEHFVEAQTLHISDIEAELAAGQKRSHWMWFAFPQLRGLGRSEMTRYYGLCSRAEAAAYLAHPVLGPRLRSWVELLLRVEGRSAHDIFGSPDDLKLRSSLTLFLEVDAVDGVFLRALAKFFDGKADPTTLQLLDDPPLR